MKNNSVENAYIKTPLGTCKISGGKQGITQVAVLDEEIPVSKTIPNPLKQCVTQLQEYFEGSRQIFELKIDLNGTAFQNKVWKSLQEIPYGKTTTYLQQTRLLGDEKAIRAVASANGKNPLWIILPCHRIIGSDGSLTGYAGGLWRKKWLLNHEQGCQQQQLF